MTLFAALAGSLKGQHASQAAGFVAVIIAAAVLIGWVGLPTLSNLGRKPVYLFDIDLEVLDDH